MTKIEYYWKMNGDLHFNFSALQGYAGPGTTLANEMNFCMKLHLGHVNSSSDHPCLEYGVIDRTVDLQSNALLLCYECP